jgi:signal transduction histidine kinase
MKDDEQNDILEKVAGQTLDDTLIDKDFDTEKIVLAETQDALAEMEAALNNIAEDNPRIVSDSVTGTKSADDLRAVLQVSLAINSSLVLEDILKIVMVKASELLSAERGFIMLLDREGNLQFKSAHNINEDMMSDEDFKISYSIANEVARTGKAVYTSDALSDTRFAKQQSVVELHLRSIMCVPMKIKGKVIGLIYLDNSSQAKLFLKSDLYLFELFASQAAHAIHNALLYKQLLNLKNFNEKIVNNSPVGVIVVDSEYNLVSINDSAISVLEKDKDDIRLLTADESPSSFFELIPKSESTKWRRMIQAALDNNQSFEDPRYFHNTGYSEKVLSVKLSPISKIPGDGDGLILILEDITEKIIMEKYVILSEKLVARGEMAASIGHELNNYLAIIANNAELLSYNLKKGRAEKLTENAGNITESIQKMKRFTDGLMDFSKLETEIIAYDIKRLIEELLFSLKAQKRFKEIELTTHFDASLPEIEVDVGQIQQVLLNLLNNAADAVEERIEYEQQQGNEFAGAITISAAYDSESSRMNISIMDNGHGIPEEHRNKIFQMHFTTKESGHGLGLANCKKIIANHNGEISLQSQVNVGTTFTVSLPPQQSRSKQLMND